MNKKENIGKNICILTLYMLFKEECMDINNMRNIVILKNLPSNLVEEAFEEKKNNQKIRKIEYDESKFDEDNFFNYENKDNENDYVIKEAELVISNYINKLEEQDLADSKNTFNLEKKCKNLKKVIYTLGCIIVIAIAYIVKM